MPIEAQVECNPQTEPAIPNAGLMFCSELRTGGLPVRSLLASLLVHLSFAWLGVYLPWSYWIPTARLVTTESMLQQHEVLLLPDLRPASNAAASNSPSSRAADSAPLETPAAAVAPKGMVYKGEQLIVSNPPRPDNFIQTIRQPDLAAPPKLPRPLPFPPMVSMAPALKMPTPALPQLPNPADVQIQAQPEAEVITLRPPDPKTQVEAPKLALPAPALPALVGRQAQVTVAKATPPPPDVQRTNNPGLGGNDARNVIIIDAVEVPSRSVLSIPPGELYGSFTVTPGPVPSPGANAASGTAGGTAPSGSNAATGTASSGSATNGHAGSAGSGTGNSAAGNGTLATGAPGAGFGHGSGSATVAGGRGVGTSNGNSPFPDITIQGGSGNNSRNIAIAPAASSPRQTSYGITIVANGATGGGFKDFGVFRDEAAYTVYLDMSDVGIRGANWTMQYATASHPVPGTMAQRSRSLLVPPFVTTKPLPHFPAAAVMRNRGSVIVVFGVINTGGNFEGLRIMQSPDADLNRLLLEALARWTFRPAEVEGTTVPVKVLLGVPISSVPQDASPATGNVHSR